MKPPLEPSLLFWPWSYVWNVLTNLNKLRKHHAPESRLFEYRKYKFLAKRAGTCSNAPPRRRQPLAPRAPLVIALRLVSVLWVKLIPVAVSNLSFPFVLVSNRLLRAGVYGRGQEEPVRVRPGTILVAAVQTRYPKSASSRRQALHYRLVVVKC